MNNGQAGGVERPADGIVATVLAGGLDPADVKAARGGEPPVKRR